MPIKPSKFASKNAQHILEYMILLILVMAGIIIGGPYAIRSWNAQMKGWEDSVIDSMNDPLVEAPVGSVSLQGCDTGTWEPGLCGATSPLDRCTGEDTTCPTRWKLFTRTFSPEGCQCNVPAMTPAISAKCDQNNSFDCCTDWVVPSGCTFPAGDTPPAGCLVPAIDCGANATCRDGSACPCPDLQYRRTRDCDVDETGITECVPDARCNNTCGTLGQPGPSSSAAYGSLCPDDNKGLTAPLAYTYVNPGYCTLPQKCEIFCSLTFISYGTSCGCPAGQTIGPSGRCICGVGFVKACPDGSGGYIAGQCASCGIPTQCDR